MSKSEIYLDNAATTRVSDKAFEAMLPFLRESFGNPSSIHSLGIKASRAVKSSREIIAELLNVEPSEIIFTSCATESNNFALKAAARLGKENGKDLIVTSKTEHPSVLNTVKFLESNGFEAKYLDVDKNGVVNIDELKNYLGERTALVSIQAVNNETGAIQPIEEIAALCGERGLLFHTDAVQAVPHLKLDLKNIDMMSVSGHKFHAPKGIGFLYRKKNLSLEPLLHGGGQESGSRSGTENAAFIAALAAAFEETCGQMAQTEQKLRRFSEKILSAAREIPDCVLNGAADKKIPSILNFSIKDVQSEPLVLQLDLKGVCCSAASACSADKNSLSHVLLAMGLSEKRAGESLRISMSRFNTENEIEEFLKILTDVTAKIRKAVKK